MSGQNYFGRAVGCIIAAMIAILICSARLDAALVEGPIERQWSNAGGTSKEDGDEFREAVLGSAEPHPVADPRPGVRVIRPAARPPIELRQIGPEAFDLLARGDGGRRPRNRRQRELLAAANRRPLGAGRRLTCRSALLNHMVKNRKLADAAHRRVGQAPAGVGVAALCRIARYDRSSVVSRTAALAIIRPKDPDGDSAAN